MRVKEGNKNTMKYHKEYEWYDKQPEPKASKIHFINRVIRYGYSYEEAIAPGKIVFKPKPKTHVDENGRECTKCGIYKERTLFAKQKHGLHSRTGVCKDCRNKYKQEYREKTNREGDKEYRRKKRKLNPGQQIMINDEIREILDYKYKKGYTIRSLFSGEEKRFSACDNFWRKNNKSAVRKFTVLTNNIELVETKKEEIEEQTFEKPKFKLSLEDMFEEDYYN